MKMSKKWSRLIFYINKFYLFNRKNYIYAMLYPLLVIPLFYGLMIYHFVHLFMPAEKWRKKTKKDREYDDSTWTDNSASSDAFTLISNASHIFEWISRIDCFS